MRIIFKIIYKYISGIPFVDIAFDLSIDRNTASGISDLIREIICESIALNNEMLGGINEDGSSKIVEIDESLFFKRKYNRGRIQNGQWFVGGIERNSRKCFIVPVENRNAITMLNIIQENVLPGTRIITDQWRAYATALSNLTGYEHQTINHSLHFVDPIQQEVHTQNIEGLWSRSKYFLRKK